MYVIFYFSFFRHCFVMEWNTNKKLSGFLPYTLQGRKPDNFSFIFSEERISFWILLTFIKKMVILSLINIHHTTFFFEMWKLESVHNILFFILQALFCHGMNLWSHLFSKYEQKIVRISALHTTGQKAWQLFVHIFGGTNFILNFTDLYKENGHFEFN